MVGSAFAADVPGGQGASIDAAEPGGATHAGEFAGAEAQAASGTRFVVLDGAPHHAAIRVDQVFGRKLGPFLEP